MAHTAQEIRQAIIKLEAILDYSTIKLMVQIEEVRRIEVKIASLEAMLKPVATNEPV